MSRSIQSGVGRTAVFGVLATLLVMLLMGTPANADASGAPSAPSLYEPVTTHNSVTLKWVADEGPADSGIRYIVERRSNGLGYSRVSGSTRTGRSYSDGAVAILFRDRGLDPDTYYIYRVYAVQGSRWSAPSGRVTAITDSAPESYVAPEPTPASTPEATPVVTPVATPEATPETTPVVTEETPPVVTEEDAGQQTNTEQGEPLGNDGASQDPVDPVTEQNSEGEKDTTLDEQNGGLGEQDTAVTRTTSTDTSIDLTWNAAVADPTLGIVTGYRIWWGTSPARATVSNDVETLAGDTLEVNHSIASTRSEEFSGLTPYTIYYFWVAPLFGSETDAADRTAGRISSRMTVTTAHEDKSPSRVRDLTATEESDGSIRLSWTAAEAATGCAVSAHRFTLRALNSGARAYSIEEDPRTFFVWPFINFDAGTRYIFGVQAACGADNAILGEPTWVAFTKGPDAGTPPTPDLYPPYATATRVSLKWWTQEKPADENWGFIVERKNLPNDWVAVSGTYGQSFEYRTETDPDGGGGWATIFYDDNVQPDTYYTYRVKTVDRDNSNAESAVSSRRLVRTPLETVETAPGVPTNVQASWRSSNSTVLLTWDAPDDDGGSSIIGYEIIRTGGPEGSTVFTRTGDTHIRIHIDILKVELTRPEDLEPSEPPLVPEEGKVIGPMYSPTDQGVLEGLYYNYYVRAINANGMSDKSAAAAVATEVSNIAPVVDKQREPNSPGGSVTLAQVTNEADDSDSATRESASMTVTWTHGTAGTRVCHTDYHIVLGWDGVYKRGVNRVSTLNPSITFSGLWVVLTHDPIGPYTRSLTAEIGGTWSDADIDRLSVAVYCGHADNGDRVGEADATLA